MRGFSFAEIGWITAIPSFDPRAREAMTDRRPLLRAIFDAAVAAAHPDVVLSAHLRALPKGRVICLAAGKAAAAMAAAAERYYLDELGLEPARLLGIATGRCFPSPRERGTRSATRCIALPLFAAGVFFCGNGADNGSRLLSSWNQERQ